MAIEWRQRASGMLASDCEDLTLEAFRYGTGFRAIVSVAEAGLFDAFDFPTLDAAKSAAEAFAREWVAAQAAALGDGWVSVEERLPESDNVQVMVLAFHPTCNVAPFYAFAYYKRETGLFCAGGGGVYGNLTHWCPLPPLPAAEVGE